MYVASKHAVRVFSDGLRREITRKRANIKVTVSLYRVKKKNKKKNKNLKLL